uniref:VPS37 C-terminal domain-containing protein n=1 Tax=Spongospora subterranea TaxID=70186 RepID=A0A0H5QZ91_9EUKA|eukprot:CRZ07032.1 hypothetical protein [Spongospora subterranea]
MFRRKQAPSDQPRQLQISELKRLNPAIIVHPDLRSFDLPVHTSTCKFLLLIRLPDEFPTISPMISVSIAGASHPLLCESSVRHSQLGGGWNPQYSLGSVVHGIVLEFFNNPPVILEQPQLKPVEQPRNTNPAMENIHPTAIALPPLPTSIAETGQLSVAELKQLISSETDLDFFIEKLPIWNAVSVLRDGIEHDVAEVANTILGYEEEVNSLRDEIVALQSRLQQSTAEYHAAVSMRQSILSRHSPRVLGQLAEERADIIDVESEDVRNQYSSSKITEDEFVSLYISKRVAFHQLMVMRERLLGQARM